MAGDTGSGSRTRWRVSRDARIALVAGWVAVAALSFLLDRLAGVRFLNMPLGLFVAGQGALIALVIVAVRAARDEDDAQL